MILIKRNTTQQDVARQAGVSTAVVSAVVSPRPNSSIRVGADTAKRVQDAVEKLGYAPNIVAQSLAGSEKRLVGVFTYESVFPSERVNFFYPFLLGIERGAANVGFDLLLYTSASRSGGARSIYADGSNRMRLADGAILLGQEPSKVELSRLVKEGYNFVTIGRREIETGNINFVAADYKRATQEMVARCIELGHQSIAYLGEQCAREQHIDREHGYLSGLQTAGLAENSEWILRIEPDQIADTGAAWLKKVRGQGVTAILAESAEHAAALEAILQSQGESIPENLSVAALAAPLEDDKNFGRWTRIRIPREEMGEIAVTVLLDILADRIGSPVQRVLPCTLVVGETLMPV